MHWRRRRPAFRGIYPSFTGIPSEGWFSGDEWRSKAIGQVHTARADTEAFIPNNLSLSKATLAAVVGPMLSDERATRILDFGGAAGADYVNLRNCIGDAKVDYTVVDDRSLVTAGSELFSRDPNIRFLNELPKGVQFDIVYSCSSIQYVEDYMKLFETFASYCPRAMLFIRQCIARSTFARQQLNRGSMPEWALGLDEIRDIMYTHGYQLVMKCYSEDDFNSDNYPLEYRLERSANLLFSKSSST